MGLIRIKKVGLLPMSTKSLDLRIPLSVEIRDGCVGLARRYNKSGWRSG